MKFRNEDACLNTQRTAEPDSNEVQKRAVQSLVYETGHHLLNLLTSASDTERSWREERARRRER